MPDSFLTAHFIVKGKVQGVGFRAFVQHVAEKNEIFGSVKNLSDGSVEIYAQGASASLDLFSSEIKNCKGLAKIDNFSEEQYPNYPKQFSSFEIIF